MTTSSTAFVLGGGGHLGAHQVGMLRALFEAGIHPDLVVGTSVGAVNGAFVAADPTVETVAELERLWRSLNRSGVFRTGSLFDEMRRVVRKRTHVYDNAALRRQLAEALPVEHFEDLAVPFECVATSIERSVPVYFSSGVLIDAIVASCSVPGLLPPVEIDGEHLVDGGLVASIPLDRAIALEATEIYVLQVGRIEEPLVAPTSPWEVAMIAFEIARRHRFAEAMAAIPDGTAVHVVPSGEAKAFNDLRQYRESSGGGVGERIDRSYRAASEFLSEQDAR